MNPTKLSDEVLIAVLDKFVDLEHESEAEMIDFIREVKRRRLWIKFGAKSMFNFMTHAHYHYPRAVAQRKLDAAQAMQVYPEVKKYMSDKELNLTQLSMLMSALRQKQEKKQIVSVKKQRAILEAMRGQTIENTQVILNEELEIEVKKRPKIRIQRDGSVRVELTFSKEQWANYMDGKDVVSHSVPSGDMVEVLDYCVRFTISKKSPFAPTRSESKASARQAAPESNQMNQTASESSPNNQDASKPQNPSQDSTVTSSNAVFSSAAELTARPCKGIGAAARRFVFRRDRYCRHVKPNGAFCESRYQLQVDHVISRWLGGGNNVENLQLLCGIHNRYKYEMESGLRIRRRDRPSPDA